MEIICDLTKRKCIMDFTDCNECLLGANKLKTSDGTITDDEGNIIKIDE